MAVCRLCGDFYDDARKVIGYLSCMECGNKAANKETEKLKKCLAPLFPKGAYQYVSSKEQALWMTKK